jgi:glycosyltransferase involved in cell wall biosynthesis
MKVLFFINGLSCGGKERRLVELLKALKSVPDIECELVLMSLDISYKEVFDLNINIQYVIRKTKKDLSGFRKFYNICMNYKPDIVHCWDSMTAVYSVPVCKLLNIILLNGMVVDTPVIQNITNKNYLRAKITFLFSDIIVGNSKAGLKAYNAQEKKSVCIYNGVDLSRFNHLKEPSIFREELLEDGTDDVFIVGMVAAFEERKDYTTLIKAAIQLCNSYDKVRFLLVGDGIFYDEIKRQIPSNLSRRIVFLGRRTDVESIVNIFNIGVLLTNSKVHGEGVSNSIIEYMALAKPVIATRGGGTNEVVFDNQNGYLIDPANSDQLVEKIEKLMNNPDLVKEYGSKSKKLLLENFDLRMMTKHYINLYGSLITKKNR